MKRIILITCLFFALSASAGDVVTGGFVIAPLSSDGFVAGGTCLAATEAETEGGRYTSGFQLFVTNASVMTGIESIKGTDESPLFTMQGNKLTSNIPSTFYTIDGRKLFHLKANANIECGSLPDLFIVKFSDGKSYKIVKQK